MIARVWAPRDRFCFLRPASSLQIRSLRLHIPVVMRGIFALLFSLCLAAPAFAAQATVAVAANFLTTAETLAERYEDASGHDIVLAHGSTGRLYAQILNGAPYDLFLSADAARPERIGPAHELSSRRIAIADPALAPFGAASREVLASLDLDPDALDIVYADSVGQVAALFETGNADLAFLASGQVDKLREPIHPAAVDALHTPIRQDAVILARADGNAAALGFFEFLGATEALMIIAEAGYGVPE